MFHRHKWVIEKASNGTRPSFYSETSDIPVTAILFRCTKDRAHLKTKVIDGHFGQWISAAALVDIASTTDWDDFKRRHPDFAIGPPQNT